MSKKPIPDTLPEKIPSSIKIWRVKEWKEKYHISLEGKTGRYVRIQLRVQANPMLGLAEVEVMGN